MPRDITVKFNDGSTTVYRGAPDDLTPELVTQRAEQEHTGLKVIELDGGKQGAPKNTAVQTGASLLAGFGKAAAFPFQILGMAGTPDYPNPLSEWGNSASEFYSEIAKKYGLENRWGKAAVEGVGGGLAFGGVGPVAMASNAIGGLSSEGAAALLGDNPLVRFVGGLVGGVGSGFGLNRLRNAVSPQLANLSARAMEDLTPELLERASALQASAKASGVDMDLAQAVTAVGGKAANLTRLRDALANARQGQETQRFLEAQPSQLWEFLQRGMQVPRAADIPVQQAANNLQEAATGAVQGSKNARASAVRGLYAKAGNLPPEAGAQLAKVAEDIAAQPGMTDAARSAAQGFASRMRGEFPELQRAVDEAKAAVGAAATASKKGAARAALQKALADLQAAKQAPLRALDVDTAISQMVGDFKGSPLNPTNAQVKGQIKHLGKELNRKFQSLSPEVRAAEAEFARLSDEVVNPMKQSVTGKVAQSRGYLDNIEAQQTIFDRVMKEGADPGVKVSPVIKLATDVGKVDKQAFPDRLQAYIRTRINEASDAGGSAMATANNQDLPQRVWSGLFGNVSQAQGMRDAVAVIAKQQGRDPHEAVRGLDRIIAITAGLKARVRPGGMTPDDIMTEGGHSMIATGVGAMGQPFQTARRRIELANLGKAYSQLDVILTTPEGYKLLQKAARAKTESDVLRILGNFGGAAAVSNGQSPTGQ